MSLFCPNCHGRYADDSFKVCPKDGGRLYAVDDEDPLIGAVVDGRFRIDYVLGEGGMGTVYGAVQLSVNRDVAIKVLRPELSTRDVTVERFFREAQMISRLTHPNIVKLIDFGQDRERSMLYLVMEFVKGRNLGDLLREGRLRTGAALEIAYQVCGALTEPHSSGAIHRDLKPDNLVLTSVSDGRIQVKVLDFGIARVLESDTPQLTGTGMICGTPSYMPPEQAQNEPLDARTDLYSLGVILYEMLSGWRPFTGTSSLQIMLQHIQLSPPSLRELLPPATLPPQLEGLVYQLMSKDPEKRPSSARELRERIDEIRQKFRIEAITIDPDLPIERQFEGYVLPKLPRAENGEPGNTQALRRETGLEHYLTAVDDDRPTNLYEASDGSTERAVTKGGGQQAWTPAGRSAVRVAEADIDVMAETMGLDSVEDEPSVDAPRRTMVEPDQSAPVRVPSTEETSAVPSTDPAQPQVRVRDQPTGEGPAATTGSNATMLVIAGILGLVVVGAAGFVLLELRSRPVEQPVPTVSVTTPAQPEGVKPPEPQAPTSSQIVQARDRAAHTVLLAHVAGALEAVQLAAKVADKPRPKAGRDKPPIKPAVQDVPPKPNPRPSLEDVLNRTKPK